MWYNQRYRRSKIHIILFSILFIISIRIAFYDKIFSKLRLPFRNYLRVRLDLTSNTAICQSNDNLIIYTLSTATNFQRRKVIRSTWASPLLGTCFVFILGKIQDNNSIQLLINNEKQQHKDIIQIDHTESYENVVYKEIAALQWSSHFFPSIPYLFKTDDDLIVDSIMLSDIAQVLVTNLIKKPSYISKHYPLLNRILLSSDRPTFFRSGWPMDDQPTPRYSKYAISKSVWSEPYLPPYCSGFGWLMSKNIRDKLLDASYTYPFNKIIWIGDIFISGLLAKAANVKCTEMLIDYEQLIPNCSCLMDQQPMLTVCASTFHLEIEGDERINYKEYEKAWKVIRQRHGLINKPITDVIHC